MESFIYRPLGLLDNTHIRFFTDKSLEKMASDCGFKILEKNNVQISVPYTEFGNKYNDVPQNVADIMKLRENGETYQYVWSLQIK